MTGFTDRVSLGILNHITGKSALFAMPTCFVGLFTAVGTDAGTGFAEATGPAYARVATASADWNTASGSAPSQITNFNPLNFPTPTANWGTVIAFGLYDAATGGNLMAWDFLGNYPWLPTTVGAASPAVFTAKAHGYNLGDLVAWSIEYGGVAPTITQGSLLGQLAVASPTVDTFTVTSTGTAVFASTTGNGMVRKLLAQSVVTGATPSFAAGALTITSS